MVPENIVMATVILSSLALVEVSLLQINITTWCCYDII